MKKNKIFINKVNGKKGNNQLSCEIGESYEKIDDKLNRLFNTNGYIFNTSVKIITNNKIYDTKIATKVGNSIITLDNDIIKINDIKDIVF